MSPLPMTDKRLLTGQAVRSLVDAFFSVAQRTRRSLRGRANLLNALAPPDRPDRHADSIDRCFTAARHAQEA